MRYLLPAVALAASAAISAPASAAEIWFDTEHAPFHDDGYYPDGAGLSFSGGGVSVTATAWSINYSDIIDDGQLGIWSPGLGVLNGSTDGNHTIDNSGYLDFIILQFDKVVELKGAWLSASSSWGPSDTDATIGYAIGALPALDGASSSILDGFNLYDVNGSGSGYRDLNTSGHVGNLWLIGASFNNGDRSPLDGFKLEKIKFEATPAVPEPATWLMMILGFGLVGGMMRSQRRQKLAVSYS